MEDCLLADSRIYAISNLQFTQEGLDYMSITLDLQTESGVLPITLEVKNECFKRISAKYTYDYILTEALSKVPDNVDKREGSIIRDALSPCCYEAANTYYI